VLTAICVAAVWSVGAIGSSRAAGAPFQPLDVFELRWASHPEISPDGKLIVYTLNWMDIRSDRRRQELRVVGPDGTGDRALLHLPGNFAQARWSRDGRSLLFVGSDHGPPQVWIWNRNDGAARQATSEPGAVLSARWSTDGRHIAFLEYVASPQSQVSWFRPPNKPADADWAPTAVVTTAADFQMDASFTPDGTTELPKGHRAVFVLDVESGRSARVTDEPFDESDITWSADDRFIYFCTDRTTQATFPRHSQIFRVPAEGGPIAPVIESLAVAKAPAVSPDGRHLGFLGVSELNKAAGIATLYVSDPDGKGVREITGDLDRNIAQWLWSADGRGVYVSYPDHGVYKLATRKLDESGWHIAADHLGPSDMARPQAQDPTFSLALDGTAAIAYTDSRSGGDVAIGRGRTHRLTDLSSGFLERHALAEVTLLDFKSRYDGLPLQGWLYHPAGLPRAPRPLVLFLHGGPWGTFSGDFFGAEPQLYAAAGYQVLALNYRGSGGYGAVTENLVSQDFPGHAYDDLMSAVDFCIEAGWADPANLFVTGGSAGGELTAWIVGHTRRFRAAAVEKPVTDALSEFGATDQAAMYQVFFASPPWVDPIEYLRGSPIYYVQNVTTPTLLIAGQADLRTPIGQSIEFFEALKGRGVDTALVRLPGAYHELSRRPSQLITAALAVRGWFDAHRAPPSRQ
jgi:dipeptidyl aminopeptidase/acylaminoacyl peptidase